MSEKILLELTEKEVETVQAALIKERASWEDKGPSEVSGVTKERHMTSCNSVWAKIDEASRTQPDVLITEKDFFNLKSISIDEYKRLPSNIRLSNKELEHKELVHISVANALLMWLNGKGLLKKLVRFDITDDSTDYEGNEY